ncbi:MAG: imelysin family protein [Chloroherpetonaceae bacterium]|nr:imelysin family protein [Chloroherpetonaceae bacterium]
MMRTALLLRRLSANPLWSLVLTTTAIATAATFAVSCNNGTTEGSTDSFDRRSMLRNIAENFIIPSYSELQSKVNAMQAAVNAFTASPSEAALRAAQQAWEEAYTAWQYACTFDFGPATTSTGTLFQKIGVFPTNAARIEERIQQRNFSTDDFSRDTRGFNAAEYLLFSDSTLAQIISRFSNPDRRQYLQAIVADIKANVDATANAWQRYRAEFITNDGTSVGSSTSMLFNEFVKSFEHIKNFKVGLPAGKRPGQTRPEPQKVEAFYSGKSVKFIREHLQAIEMIYLGMHRRTGIDDLGFDDYLRSVPNGAALVISTLAQLELVKQRMNALPDAPLSQTIVSNFAVVDAFHTELQRHTRFFKSEMASLLSLTITFSSGDGD